MRRAAVVRGGLAVVAATLAVALAASRHDDPRTARSDGLTPSIAGDAGRSTAPEHRPSSGRVRQGAMLRLPTQPPARHLVLPILMYHRIDAFSERLPEITRRLTVDPLDFERQMRWLERHGYRTVTQREVFAALIDGRSLGAKPVLITFDDGYRNVLGKAAPVLRHLGFHATAYVITGRISRPDPSFLTWAQLRALERLGIEIGSHTVSHVDLTALSDDMLARELRASRRVLERELGHTVQWLAYPYGAHDQRVVRAARRAGYVLAVTTVRGVSQRATQTLELHRLRVLDDTTIVDLDAMLRDERA